MSINPEPWKEPDIWVKPKYKKGDWVTGGREITSHGAWVICVEKRYPDYNTFVYLVEDDKTGLRHWFKEDELLDY